jgi:hypothetical protein
MPNVVVSKSLTRPARPSQTNDGLYAAALRFGDPRVMALLGSLVGFCHVTAGFSNRDLIALVSALLPERYTSRQATYDLRRLIRKDLIVKIPHTRRYQLTALGRRVAVLFTKTYGRVLAPGLAALDPRLPDTLARRRPLAVAWNRFESTLNDFIEGHLIAA